MRANNYKNIKGQKFGDFEAIDIVGKDKSSHLIWRCRCPECGNEIQAATYDLTHNRTNTHCSCHGKVKVTLKKILDKIPETAKKKVKLTPIEDDSYFSTEPFSDGDYTTTSYEAEGGIDYSQKIIETKNVVFVEVPTRLEDVSFSSHVAHAISNNYSMTGPISSLIDACYGMKKKLEKEDRDFPWGPMLGTCIPIENVFNLIVYSREHADETLRYLHSAVMEMANYCCEADIRKLAITHVCCGTLGYKWEDVKKIIVDDFIDVYNEQDEVDGEASHIRIFFLSPDGDLED